MTTTTSMMMMMTMMMMMPKREVGRRHLQQERHATHHLSMRGGEAGRGGVKGVGVGVMMMMMMMTVITSGVSSAYYRLWQLVECLGEDDDQPLLRLQLLHLSGNKQVPTAHTVSE
jgi:hypothetical protein